jgi:hypothetical protein
MRRRGRTGAARTVSTRQLTVSEPSTACGYPHDFESAWGFYPKRPGASKPAAFKAWSASLARGGNPTQMLDGAVAYAKHCAAQEKPPQFVLHPKTFFGPDEHWLCEWPATPRVLTRYEENKEKMEILTGQKASGAASQAPDTGSIFEGEARRVA